MNGVVDQVTVVARTTDPETSQMAAAEFNGNQGKVQRSVQTVVRILRSADRPLSDFEIRDLWGLYWGGAFSSSLPRKARHWAREQGLVKHAGYARHNGRKVRSWALGAERLEDLVPCPTCGRKMRNRGFSL